MNILIYLKGSLNPDSANGINTGTIALMNELSFNPTVNSVVLTSSNKPSYPFYKIIDRGRFLVYRYKSFPTMVFRIISEIKKSNIIYLSNLYILENTFISLICILIGRSYCIVTCASCMPDRKRRSFWKKKLFDLLVQNFVIKKAKYLFVDSNLETKFVKKDYPFARVKLIRNFVDFIDQSEILYRDPSVIKELTIGYLGRFSEEKNLLTLLKWIKNLDLHSFDIKLKFKFSGPFDNEYGKEFANTLNYLDLNNVELTSQVASSEKNDWFNSIDFFVLQSFSDSGPLVCAEALRQGRPLICSDTAGIDPLDSDVIFMNDNSNSGFNACLKSAIAAYLSNPFELQEKSKDLFSRFYSTQANVKEMLKAFSEKLP